MDHPQVILKVTLIQSSNVTILGMLTFYCQLNNWADNNSVMWQFIQANLSVLNEECGEIVLSMLSRLMFKSQKGDIKKTSEKFQETTLRFGMGKVISII